MFKNYFKTAWRYLMKNKIFSLINIAGLSIGISAALVIFLIVQHDYSFYTFEKNNDRIYRVVENYTQKASGKSNGSKATPDLLQFIIAQVFIIATLLVSKQINYTLNKNIGIKKNAVLYFYNATDTSSAKKNLLINKLKAIPGIASVSLFSIALVVLSIKTIKAAIANPVKSLRAE